MAQDLVRQNAFEPAASVRESISVRQDGDTVQVGGWDFKATITAEGLHYVPALGMGAATTQHLAIRPVSYGRQSQQQPVLAGAALARGAIVDCARGPGVVERYEVTPEGVALSWHFGARPAGRGDLIARYRLETSLPTVEQTAEGLGFHLPEVGGVHIGAVTGIDATGARVAGELRLEGEFLELSLPAAFVDEASFPLVLDPLIGTQFLATTDTTWNDSQPDVAYDDSNDIYLVVYRRVFSTTSQGLRAQRIDGSGALVGGFISIITSPGIANPTVANLNARDTFVVAWQSAASVIAPYDILCRSVNAANGAFSATATIASAAANEVDPDASGNNTTTDDRALIVYTVEGSGIRLARVSVASPGATPVLASTTTVTSGSTARWPTISKSNPSDSAYLIAYWEASATLGQIRVRACDRLGTLLGTSYFVVTNGSLITNPPGRMDVDGDGSDFVVAYEYPEGLSASFGEHDLWCRGINWNGTSLSANTTFTALDTAVNRDQRDPSVTFCRYKYIVLYADQFLTGVNNYDIRGLELSADCTSCGPNSLLTGLNTTLLRNVELAPAMASEYGSGSDSDEAMLVFTEADDSPPFTSSLVAQRYEAMAGAPITTTGPTCGAGGQIYSSGGPFAVGNTDFQVNLSNIPPGGIPILLFAFPGSTLSCGPCTYVQNLASVFILPVGDTSSYTWSMPCSVAPYVGVSFVVQWATLNSGTTPCAALPSIAFSERMNLTLDF